MHDLTPRPRKHPRLRRTAIVVGILAIVIAIRVALEPKRTPAAPLHLDAAARAQISQTLAASTVERTALFDSLTPYRVLLIGESHFVKEPQTFAADLVAALHARDGRRAVLVLELPASMQASLDSYLAGGDEGALIRNWSRSGLPYQQLVRWARAHPEAVSGIVADDERSLQIGLMRLLLTDTRNETMARAVADACRTHPGDRVVVYGGRLHMMKAGRYMYDSPTRSPVGARLAAHSIAPRDVSVVWLFAGESPAGGTWSQPGAISLASAAGRLPVRVLEEEAIFGASQMGQLADYAVYLGAATPIERN